MNVNLSNSNDLATYDGRSVVLNIISFLLPPLGLILYLALMIAKLPQKAVSVGRSATFGLGFCIGAIILGYVAAGTFSVIERYQNPNPAPPTMTTTLPQFTHPPQP